MLDHVTFGVTDFDTSIAFYDAAFAPLDVRRLMTLPASNESPVQLAAYGDTRPWFWIADADPTRGRLHVAITASDRERVDAFHAAALAAGARDNGAPGPRPHYHPNYYGAFVLDPDGHNIEAVCHAPPG